MNLETHPLSKKTPRWLFAAALTMAAGAALAFPDRAITLIVPFSPGTTNDVNARDFAQVLSAVTKHPVVIDNRVGAEGTIGGQALLNAPADGHTLMFTSNSLTVFDPLLKKTLPYDPLKDFVPVCATAKTNLLVNATGSGPLKNVADLLATARARPDTITFAYSSTSMRLAGELFQQAAGVKLRSVPYRSSVTALTDLSGGQVDLIFIDRVSALPFYESGKVRPLASSGSRRLSTLPGVPTAAEAGVPGFSVQPWFGVYASARTPQAILNQVSEAVTSALKSPDMAANVQKRGLEPFTLCGNALVKYRDEETSLWRGVTRKAGIEPE